MTKRERQTGLFHSQTNHRFVGVVPRVPTLLSQDFVCVSGIGGLSGGGFSLQENETALSGKYGILAVENPVQINGEILQQPEQTEPEKLLNNRYRMIDKLGEGGFGLTLTRGFKYSLVTRCVYPRSPSNHLQQI